VKNVEQKPSVLGVGSPASSVHLDPTVTLDQTTVIALEVCIWRKANVRFVQITITAILVIGIVHHVQVS
jgi:hypothetical protein